MWQIDAARDTKQTRRSGLFIFSYRSLFLTVQYKPWNMLLLLYVCVHALNREEKFKESFILTQNKHQRGKISLIHSFSLESHQIIA